MSVSPRGEFAFMHQLRALPKDPDALEKFCGRLGSPTDAMALAAAETLFEASLLSDDDAQILRCTGNAIMRTDTVIDKNENLGLNNEGLLRARVLRAYAPLFGMVALTDQLPNPTISKKIHEKLIDTIRPVATEWNAWEEGFAKQETNLTGCAAELVSLALLQRYTAQEATDRTWAVAPTLFCQGNVNGKGKKNSNWDISCLDQQDDMEPPQLACKIEIKSSKTAVGMSKKPYADDIHVVSVREVILTETGGSVLSYQRALQLLTDEYDGLERGYRYAPSHYVDMMTDKLFSALSA